MADINDLDSLVTGEFDYLQSFDAELQKCLNKQDLTVLYQEYIDKIDDNMWALYNQRKEEINCNPVDRIRNGELLKIRGTGGVYHAIHLLAKRND